MMEEKKEGGTIDQLKINGEWINVSEAIILANEIQKNFLMDIRFYSGQ